jgi:hypothetical protein
MKITTTYRGKAKTTTQRLKMRKKYAQRQQVLKSKKVYNRKKYNKKIGE